MLFLNTIKISGRIHSDVYARWKNGDQLVKEGMKSFADFTTEAVEALQSQNWTQLGKLMDMNFDKRREIYGEAALGSKNLQMIEIARKHSAHCKFPGNLQIFFLKFCFYKNNDLTRKSCIMNMQSQYFSDRLNFNAKNKIYRI